MLGDERRVGQDLTLGDLEGEGSCGGYEGESLEETHGDGSESTLKSTWSE